MLAMLALTANALQLRPLILLVARYLSLDTQKDVLVSISIGLCSSIGRSTVVGNSSLYWAV